MMITYAGDAYDSFYTAIDAMSGYTVRLDFDNRDAKPAYHRASIDVELIGVEYPEEAENEAVISYYPTAEDGDQLPEGHPARVKQTVMVADVANLYVY